MRILEVLADVLRPKSGSIHSFPCEEPRTPVLDAVVFLLVVGATVVALLGWKL